MISVLFVCTGNICRSPMAEAVFQHLVDEAGLTDQITVDSAGTDSYHVGDSAHRGTINVLERHGIHYSGISRRVTRADLQKFDYVIAMDNEHLSDLRSMGTPKGMLTRLLDFAPEQPIREVPDPYYNNGFDHVYELVLAGCEGLLARVRRDQGF